jgi:hypothetical protein
MVPPLKDPVTRMDPVPSTEIPTAKTSDLEGSDASKQDIQVSFSHIQLYTDRIGDIEEYKDLEDSLNAFAKRSSSNEISDRRKVWQSLTPSAIPDEAFVSQNRDVVKQLLVGFGFRVTGYRFPNEDDKTNTRSLLVTSRDPNGVQIVVTAIDKTEDQTSDEYFHFDAGTLGLHFHLFAKGFLQSHQC